MKPIQIRDAVRLSLLAPLTLIMLTSLGGVGWSQDKDPDMNPNSIAARKDAEAVRAARAAKEQEELDAAYKATLGKTKKPAGPVDPWSSVRSSK
jgi:hypothetical protein